MARSLFPRLLLLALALAAALLILSSGARASESAEAAVPVAAPELTPEQLEAVQKKSQHFKFEAEISRVLDIIINSLYKTKEIFLRELISNASDALDKIRFLSLTDADALKENPDLKIEVKADKVANTITITDSGLGMTQADLVQNLGTLAKSGTNEFLKALENNTADMNLIGKFGVGFYSAYLVADKVRVVTKNNADKQLIWESAAQNEFTIAEDPRGNTLGRGTEITLFLKPTTLEYLEDDTLKTLVQKYSQFINFPIFLWTHKTVSEEVPIEEGEAETKPEDEAEPDVEKIEGDVEDATDEKKEEKPKTKTVEKKVEEWEKVNTNKPIWVRNPKEVTEEEYNDFYKAFTKEADAPLSYMHFKAEGEHEFRSIIFVPPKPSQQFLQHADDAVNRNVKLYVRRVFITDEMVDFMPRWLTFLRGLVDSDDFPLNVSRETLQQHSILGWIKKKLVSKALELFKSLSKDDEKYAKFLESYGVSLKLGAIEDKLNQKKLLRLLRFQSSTDNSTSIIDYIERMKKGQTQIFYLTGSSVDDIKKSPLLEKMLARGYEVLYCADPIDEYLWQQVTSFSPKSGETFTFQNAAKAGVKFGDEDDEAKKSKETREEEFKPLTDWMKIALVDAVEKVEISDLLTKSPMAIVANQWGWTGNAERLMQGQVFKQQEQNYMMEFQRAQKKILEINDGHPVIKALLKKVQDGETDTKTSEMVRTLYEMALVRSGYGIPDTEKFAERMERVVRGALGVDEDEEAEVVIKPAEKKEREPIKPKEEKVEEKAEEETAKGAGEDASHDEL